MSSHSSIDGLEYDSSDDDCEEDESQGDDTSTASTISPMLISSISSVSSNDSDVRYDLTDEFEYSSSEDDEDMVMVARDSPAPSVDSTMNTYKMQLFRNRSFTLEECSICFEVMLLDEKLLSLPCGHKFHSSCVQCWLDENSTCPNCRKSV